MKKIILFSLLSCICFLSAQLPDISFNGTNAWTKTPSSYTGITYDTTNNQATIVGNGSSYVRTTLTKTFTVPSTLYFSADIWIENGQFNLENIKNPQVIVRDDAGNVIYRFNMDWGLQNAWYKAGIRIDDYTGASLQFEFGMNGVAGTMKVKNPSLTTSAPSFTYEFPWSLPANVSTTLSVSSGQKHNFENDLLSSNTHFIFAKIPWSSTTIQTPINTYFPMTNLRFPGGTVGNYYNYTTDNFYVNSLTPNNLITYNNNGYTLDYAGYKNFNLSSGANATYMLNVMLGTAQTAINEYQNRYSSGLPLKWIELGNEMYLSENQKASNVSDVNSYISHTQQIVSGIKNINTNAKVAVCLDKDDFNPGGWNYALSQNQTYFDAATLHNYIPIDHYFYSKYSSYGMLKSYKASLKRFTDFQSMFPNKPLLLTEWGITGNVNEPYFLNTLGVAETFLAIEKANELNIVKQAGIHMLYKNDNDEYATLMYYDSNNKLRLTTIGKLYSKLFDVFKNAEVFNAETTSAELETGLKAVNAKMVKKNSSYKIFAVNKLPVASPLQIIIDGMPYSSTYTIENYSANMNATVPGVLATTNVWTSNNATGAISLPASSISIITLTDNSVLSSFDINKANEVKIFPNPTTSTICINDLNTDISKMTYSILDASGKWIQTQKMPAKGCISVEKLSTGNYILQLKTENFPFSSFNFIKK